MSFLIFILICFIASSDWLIGHWLIGCELYFLFQSTQFEMGTLYYGNKEGSYLIFFIPPKAKVLFQFKHWAFLIIFPCIFQIDYFSLVWTILGHFISFGPFLGHFILNTLYGQGRGWSVCQFRYPSTLVHLIFYLFKKLRFCKNRT